jgi:hypothetical protein
MTRSSRRGPVAAQRTRRSAIQDRLAAELAARVRQAVFSTLLPAGDDRSATDLTVPRAAVPAAPALLARAQPGGAEAVATWQAVYERCLAHYRDTVVPALRGATTAHDDAGTAAACFLAANFAALQGTSASVHALQQLERQLGALIGRTAAWAGATLAERQLYIEKLAVLGVLMAESARAAVGQGPAAVANVRRAARGYVVEFLGLDPDGLRLGDDGLVPADASGRVPPPVAPDASGALGAPGVAFAFPSAVAAAQAA